jgi:hypothetical protein
MKFPSHIGPDDIGTHSNDTATVEHFLKLGEEIIVDFLIGHSAVVAHSDDAAAREDYQLIEVLQRLVARLNIKIKQSTEVCETVLRPVAVNE